MTEFLKDSFSVFMGAQPKGACPACGSDNVGPVEEIARRVECHDCQARWYLKRTAKTE